jgi:glutamine synthetase
MPDLHSPRTTASVTPEPGTHRWARLVFVDVFGASHAVFLPAERLAAAFEEGVLFDGSALEGRNRHLEVDMLLAPDPASLLDLGGGHLRVTCNVATPDGHPWPADPRIALGHLVEAHPEVTSGYRCSAELEFYLVGDGMVPVDRGDYFADADGTGNLVTLAAAERLDHLGAEVVGVHAEAGPGQYEIDLAATDPVSLADRLILAKAVLRETAGHHGLRATFMARPLSGEPGSGLHLHQRLAERFSGSSGQLTGAGLAVVGGQLHHARALAALAAPNVNSYRRLHAGSEAPGPVVWAHRSRAAVIRVGASPEQQSGIELRLGDPAANPYLLLGGLLAAAADGLARDLDPGPALDEDPAGFDPAAETVAVTLLPRNLEEALDALEADDVLLDAFDGALLGRLIDGRRSECEAYRQQVTPWEIEHLLDDA